jgi:hypothetical protein
MLAAACAGGSLTALAGLPASALAQAPIALDAPDNGSEPLVAYDPTTATTYVAWSNTNNGTPPDTGGIDLCVVANDATGCTGGTPVILSDPHYKGSAAPRIAGLVVQPKGEAVVVGSTAQGGVGSIAWASPAGGNGFLTGDNGLENGGNPISPVSLFYTTGNVVALSNSDVGLLDDYGDYFSDSPFAGPETPASIAKPNSNPAGPFPRKPLETGGPEIGAIPTPGVAGSETVVAVGDNYADSSYNPPGCVNYASSGFGVSVGKVGGTGSGTLNIKGIPNYGVLDCSAENPVIASGGTDGMGILEEEGPGVSGEGTDITMDWRPFLATATGGTFGAPVELTDLTSQVLVGVNILSVVDDSGTGVYALWTDEQGLVLDYSPNGGANWYPPVLAPPLINSSGDELTQGDPVIAGVGNGVFELAYDNNLGIGNQDYLQTLNYADLLPVTPVTVATNQTSGTSTGPNLTIPAGTLGETDKATIEGANAATATGTLAYGLYSSPTCTPSSQVSPTSTAPVIAGVATSSVAVVTALAPGQYYWQATYSGDDATLANGGGNQPGVSACGSEVLTIAPGATVGSGITPPPAPPTGGGTATTNGSTVTITITCATLPCTVTITITAPEETAKTASASRFTANQAKKKHRKPKIITLATGTFKITHPGPNKLTLHLTKSGKKLLEKDHGHLKAKLLLSDKTSAGTLKSSRTIAITTVKPKHKKK